MRLEVAGISKRYGGRVALEDVGFTLDRPGITGLIGPNGAGKTTLFDIVAGRVAPDRGTVRLDTTTISGLPPFRIARMGVARTFQECRVLPDETCLANLLFALQEKPLLAALHELAMGTRARREHRERAMRMLELVNLGRYAHEPAGALSFGQKRLLEIGSALITRPHLVLLDEPASGVSPALLNVLRDFIAAQFRETQALFLIVEHNMAFLMELSDRVIVMHQGRVLEDGTPDAVRSSRQVIDAYLG